MILKCLAFITLVFFTMRFFVAAVNVIFCPVLKRQKNVGNPLVSILIPARNEEGNIQNILNDLKIQSYTNIEVIVFNDQSTDLTKAMVLTFTEKDTRFKLIDSVYLPEGWLGKNNACHQLALNAKGNYLLFLDADVRVRSGLIESTLAQMQKHKLKLLSIFPQQEMKTPGEKIIVPIMNFILLSLLPMILTRESRRVSLAAANGQFMMFNKETYLQIRPHKKVKNYPVEDILISRLFKAENQKIECLSGNEMIRCRMYHGLNDAIQGFARNVVEFFGGSYAIAIIYWILSTFGIVIVALSLPIIFTVISLMLIIGIITFISLVSLQPIWQNLIYALPRQLFLGIIVIFSYINKQYKINKWKGRNIDY